MDKPVWNRQLNDWEVCGDCLEVIFNVFEDTPERPAEEEEEILDDDTLLKAANDFS